MKKLERFYYAYLNTTSTVT